MYYRRHKYLFFTTTCSLYAIIVNLTGAQRQECSISLKNECIFLMCIMYLTLCT